MLQVLQAGQARGFGVVACCVGGDEVVDGVVGVAGPGQEVVDGAAGAELAGAVRAGVALCFGERSADALQTDPLGSEQELVQPLGVDEVAVAGGYPGGPLGLDEWPDERGEADEPAAHAGAQPQAEVMVRRSRAAGR